MDAPVISKKKKHYLLIALAILLVALVLYIVWKVWFEFDNATVATNVQARLAQSDSPDKDNIIIQDGMRHIMASTFLTQQVKDYAKLNNLPPEQVLVNAAVSQGQSLGYL